MATIPINNMTDTWNNSGTTFNSILMNVTNTASASGSNLMNLQVGGTTVFNVGAPASASIVNIPLGTITANAKALNITGTWNASGVTFDAPLFMNITNTASATKSALIDLQLSGSSNFAVYNNGGMIVGTPGGTSNYIGIADNLGGPSINTIAGNTSSGFQVAFNSQPYIYLNTGWASFDFRTVLGFGSGNATASQDIGFYREVASEMSLANPSSSTTATAFRIYNTTDHLAGGSPTNYERGVFDWTTTANTLTIGTQAGGTGSTSRAVNISAGGALSLFTGGNFQINNGNVLVWLNGNGLDVGGSMNFGLSSLATNASGTIDAGISRVASGVTGIINANGQGNASGWLNWAGEARLDADFSATSNTTLANVTGTSNNLSVSLQAGRKYIFDICLLMVTGASLGGMKIGLAGTATVTNLIADGWALDGTTNVAVTRVSASPGTLVANTNAGTAPVARFMGTFECNVAGTFTVQFAQNVSNATSSTVKRGSYMKVHDAP